ncbi:MAG: cysteine--tRNA ligase [Acidobacteriales bacterium]|nr:cysteine--tRNA ligase [Terriglobales bacterium]
MALRFYNTLTERVEDFSPLQGPTVRMYTCGPTVYNYVHIGNLRTFTFQDILRRWLRYRGYQLDHVMNLTDVDDRIIQLSVAAGKTIAEYTEVYAQAFLDDCTALRLERPEHIVKATDHITDMAQFIRRLTEKGFTYERDGSIYFSIAKFPAYGRLSHSDFSGIKAGARVDVDRYDKDDARDFALWKAPKPGEPFWDCGVGPGRPGWHIECAVMATKYLGGTIDIHTGGVDLVFPHHENEIAEAEALTGQPFVRYWLHAEHLLLADEKMSKSLGNTFTLREMTARGYHPDAIRYLLSSVPYRKKLNFTFDALDAAANAIERLRNYKLRLDTAKFPAGVNAALDQRAAQAVAAFETALDDDLNTAEALGAVFEFVRETNTAMDAGEFLAGNVASAKDVLVRFDKVFDVLEPRLEAGALSDDAIQSLIDERNAARKARNFARADQIRGELLEKGIILEDTKDGVRWKRK